MAGQLSEQLSNALDAYSAYDNMLSSNPVGVLVDLISPIGDIGRISKLDKVKDLMDIVSVLNNGSSLRSALGIKKGSDKVAHH